MDIKKLDEIKTPTDWLEQALQPEKKTISYKRKKAVRKFRLAAAIAIIFVAGGTFMTATATKSTIFQSLLAHIFGTQNVSEVELDSQPKEETADVKIGKDNTMKLEENTMVVGEKESFICEYHFVNDTEQVDSVYTVVPSGLKKMTPVTFESQFNGQKCSFNYVTSGNEIYAFNYTGGITEIFSSCINNLIYGVWEKEDGKKGCLIEINLSQKTITQISGDNMICNFIMSPDGTKILCNHRGDGYWSVFDIATHTERTIPTKLLNGYARTSEIEFLDENRILTYGESVFKGNTEINFTYVINLQTMKLEKKYPDVGLVNLHWSYRYQKKKHSLTFYEITGNQSFVIPNVPYEGHVIGQSGNYVLFGSLEEDSVVYLVHLGNHSWKKIDIPKKLKNDLEIHLVKTKQKILITNQKRAYLVDVSSL